MADMDKHPDAPLQGPVTEAQAEEGFHSLGDITQRSLVTPSPIRGQTHAGLSLIPFRESLEETVQRVEELGDNRLRLDIAGKLQWYAEMEKARAGLFVQGFLTQRENDNVKKRIAGQKERALAEMSALGE